MTHPKKGLFNQHRQKQRAAVNKLLAKFGLEHCGTGCVSCVAVTEQLINAVEDPYSVLEGDEK